MHHEYSSILLSFFHASYTFIYRKQELCGGCQEMYFFSSIFQFMSSKKRTEFSIFCSFAIAVLSAAFDLIKLRHKPMNLAAQSHHGMRHDLKSLARFTSAMVFVGFFPLSSLNIFHVILADIIAPTRHHYLLGCKKNGKICSFLLNLIELFFFTSFVLFVHSGR